MRVMGIATCLHWELRHKLEGYVGSLLMCIVMQSLPVQTLNLRAALSAAGVVPQERSQHAQLEDGLKVTCVDDHDTKGFMLSRFAITDRWGMFREVHTSERGDRLSDRATQ